MLPYQDRVHMQAAQSRALDSDGKQTDGFVQIPIDRAMHLALDKNAVGTRPGASTQPFLEMEAGK